MKLPNLQRRLSGIVVKGAKRWENGELSNAQTFSLGLEIFWHCSVVAVKVSGGYMGVNIPNSIKLCI